MALFDIKMLARRELERLRRSPTTYGRTRRRTSLSFNGGRIWGVTGKQARVVLGRVGGMGKSQAPWDRRTNPPVGCIDLPNHVAKTLQGLEDRG